MGRNDEMSPTRVLASPARGVESDLLPLTVLWVAIMVEGWYGFENCGDGRVGEGFDDHPPIVQSRDRCRVGRLRARTTRTQVWVEL